MSQSQRLYYIDWLRVGAFGLLFFFHCLRFFDAYPWHIKNDESSILVDYFVEFVHNWRMPLIFLVSGVGTFFAMNARKEKFLADRILRLMIPFGFGVILLVPPQKFLEAIHQGWFEGSFLTYLSSYPAQQMSANLGISLAWTGHLGYHIWYLAYLFVQTLLLLPLLRVLRSRSSMISRWNALTTGMLSLVWVLIPLIVLEFLLRPPFPNYLNWADFVVYSTYFLLGFLLALLPGFMDTVGRTTKIFLIAGVCCSAVNFFFHDVLLQWSVPSYSWVYLLVITLKNVNTLAWVLGLLGLAKRRLNFNKPRLRDLNQGILPFYMLHQTVIIMVGYEVISWQVSIIEKFLLILLVSFLLTIAIYQIIWRVSWLRFLFGMRAKSAIRSRKEFVVIPRKLK